MREADIKYPHVLGVLELFKLKGGTIRLKFRNPERTEPVVCILSVSEAPRLEGPLKLPAATYIDYALHYVEYHKDKIEWVKLENSRENIVELSSQFQWHFDGAFPEWQKTHDAGVG